MTTHYGTSIKDRSLDEIVNHPVFAKRLYEGHTKLHVGVMMCGLGTIRELRNSRENLDDLLQLIEIGFGPMLYGFGRERLTRTGHNS